MDGLFALGSLGFWVLFAAFNIAMFAWTELEYSGWATLGVLMALGLMNWLGDVSIFGLIAANPQYAIYFLVSYFIVGTFWSVIKWWFYAKKERRKYDVVKADFLARNGISGTSIPETMKRDFSRYLDGIDVHPKVSKHKERIYHWIVFWPWSLLWTLINDPVKRLAEELYNGIKAFLQKISDRTWAGTEEDLPKDK
jgi:hypothetical protein